MRAVVQRVASASVSVDGMKVSSIGEGLLILAGIHENDERDDMVYIRDKILGLRIFNDDKGLMNRSVGDVNGDILLVSQFTLYGDARRGRRPSYSSAMTPESAKSFFDQFVASVRDQYPGVQSGIFGAHMEISLVNSGPVTILLDSARIL